MYTDFILILVGAILVFLGITKLTFDSKKVRRTTSIIGEGPTRILYILIGLLLIYLGIFVY